MNGALENRALSIDSGLIPPPPPAPSENNVQLYGVIPPPPAAPSSADPANSNTLPTNNSPGDAATHNGAAANQPEAEASPISPALPPGAPDPNQDSTSKESHKQRGGTPRYNIPIDPTSTDQCAYSDTIDNKYACSSTHNLVNTAQMMNMMGQMTTSAMTSSAGQDAQQQAYSGGLANGQQASMDAAADLQERTGEAQMGLGIMNGMLAAYELKKSRDHKAFAAQLQSGGNANANNLEIQGQKTSTPTVVDGGLTQVGKSIFNSYDMGVKVQSSDTDADGNLTGNVAKGAVVRAMKQVGQRAASEQMEAASAASMGAMMTGMSAASQAASAAMAIQGAQELRSQANALNGSSSTGTSIVPPSLNAGSAATSGAPSSAMAITGNGINPNTAASPNPSPTPANNNPNLGGPLNTNPFPLGVPGGPTPGAYTAALPESAGGGAGGGIDGGGSTSPATATSEDPQAKADKNDGAGYESGATLAGGNGGGGKGGDSGPDLSKLAALFGGPKEKDLPSANGILDFGGGKNSQPGSGSFPALGKETDIFKRIHETYQTEQQGNGRLSNQLRAGG